MAQLSKTWITDRWIDAEYKMYLIHDYLQQVQRNFEQRKLYPDLAELIAHFREASLLHQSYQTTHEQLPKELIGFDWENFRLTYARQLEHDAQLEEILITLQEALPRFQAHIEQGTHIYEQVAQQVFVYPVGIEPLHKTEGYLLVHNTGERVTEVYSYTLHLYEQASQAYRSLHTQYLQAFPFSFTHTPTTIKLALTKQYPQLPNPATYSIETELNVPMRECLLPIAKRKFIQMVQTS